MGRISSHTGGQGVSESKVMRVTFESTRCSVKEKQNTLDQCRNLEIGSENDAMKQEIVGEEMEG